MRTLILMSGILASLSLGLGSASATPRLATPSLGATPNLTLVAGGCGIGRHRGPYGYCIPNGVVVNGAYVGLPYVGVPFVAPSPCPYGYHLGPYGRRCWAN